MTNGKRRRLAKVARNGAHGYPSPLGNRASRRWAARHPEPETASPEVADDAAANGDA